MLSRHRTIELLPVAAGAAAGAVALGVTAVVANLAGVIDEDDGSPWALPLLAVAVLGLGVAGWVAARRCRHAPLLHGAAAAIGSVALVGIVSLIRQAVSDDSISLAPAGAWLLLAVAAGVTGGLAALRPRPGANSPGD